MDSEFEKMRQELPRLEPEAERMTEHSLAEYWAGRIVLVRRCLVDKPQHSGTDFGWIIRDGIASADASKREPCHAVGRVGHTESGDVVPVCFISPWPTKSDEPIRETVLFAHVDDLELTKQPYSWPSVLDMVVREK